MAYTYLLDTYTFIEKRLEEIQRQMSDTAIDDWKNRQHAAGRIQALHDLKHFLSANFDAKLPRRILRRRR
jgi:thiamine kinase-like enzyme